MNEPKRWLDSAPNPRIRELLRTGLRDEPDAHALPRTAAALGLSAATTVASSAAAAIVAGNAAQAGASLSATGAATASVGGALAATTTGGTTALFAIGKWLAVGFVSGGIASAGVTVAQKIGSAERSTTLAAATQRVQASDVLRSSPRTPSSRSAGAELPGSGASVETLAPSRESGWLDAVGERPPAPASSGKSELAPRAPAPATSESRGALAAEIAWIDAARRALAAGDAAGALSQLDAYERTRSLGVLDREAALLRIDALQRQGELARARAVAARYLNTFPEDPRAPRLREFLGADAASAPGGRD